MWLLVRYVEGIVQIAHGLILKSFVRIAPKRFIWVWGKINVCPVLMNVSLANQVDVFYVKKVTILIHKIVLVVKLGA